MTTSTAVAAPTSPRSEIANRRLAPVDETSWNTEAAWHLLHRTQFGASPDEVQAATRAGMTATVDRLLAPADESPEYLAADQSLRVAALASGSVDDLKAWWLHRMLNSRNAALEKLTLFWHNHFATSIAKVRSVRLMLDQNDVQRLNSRGNFRAMLHGMARDVAMLTWLDGNANRRRHPNENFSREVFELFSLGLGNYTERDIQEAARAFSGWHVHDEKFWLNRDQHDDGQKTVFGKTGNFTGNEIIEMCLDQPACPKFLAMKLLRQYVVPSPSSEQIEALASRISFHRYEMKPVLRELFLSELFYSAEARRSLIKSPLDFVIGAYRQLGIRASLNQSIPILADLGQDVFAPPTVKGWEGHRLWMSSSSYLLRVNFVTDLMTTGKYGTAAGISGSRDQVVAQLLGVPSDTALGQTLTALKNASAQDIARFVMSLPEYNLL